jgi:hypothetical protein
MSHLNECGQLCTFTQDRDFSDAVLNQTEHVLTDPLFSHSPQLKRFLRFAVAKTLAGEGQKLKEYTIAVEALGKPETFDPRLDSIVRVEARRLRNKLHLYYSTRGASDDIFIRFEQGHYVPRVAKRSAEKLPLEGDSPRVRIVEAPAGHADELAAGLRSLGFPYKKVAQDTTETVQWDFDVTILCADSTQSLESCLGCFDRGLGSGSPLVLALSYDTLRECAAVACSSNIEWVVLPARPIDLAAAIHIAIAKANSAGSELPPRVSAASSAA